MDIKKINYINNIMVLKLSYSRNSFDRFGDDLCEEILQYLSFEDKIKFECVNKQWKTTIYQRQFALETRGISLRKKLNSLNEFNLFNIHSSRILSVRNFECVLKKCPKINCINIREFQSHINNSLIHIIIKNCTQLKKLKWQTFGHHYCHISSNTVKEIGTKFGESLLFIKGNYGFDYNYLFDLCPNIVSISDINLSDLIDNKSDVILVPKLNKITDIFGEYSYDLMNRFVMRYSQNIKVFGVVTYRCNNFINFFSQLSQLNNLEKISLFFRSIKPTTFAIGFKNFADACCEQIKNLSIDVTTTNIVTIINKFTEIKSLKMNLLYNSVSNKMFAQFSFELIKNCKKLTRLEIYGFVNDKYFNNIEIYLPKLTVVKITATEGGKITNKSINSLAYLSNLREFCFKKSCHENISIISHKSICNLLEKCLQFRSFYFSDCPRINTTTILKFVEIARNRSNFNFFHSFYHCTYEQRKIIKSTIVGVIEKNGFPNNLNINYN